MKWNIITKVIFSPFSSHGTRPVSHISRLEFLQRCLSGLIGTTIRALLINIIPARFTDTSDLIPLAFDSLYFVLIEAKINSRNVKEKILFYSPEHHVNANMCLANLLKCYFIYVLLCATSNWISPANSLTCCREICFSFFSPRNLQTKE